MQLSIKLPLLKLFYTLDEGRTYDYVGVLNPGPLSVCGGKTLSFPLSIFK